MGKKLGEKLCRTGCGGKGVTKKVEKNKLQFHRPWGTRGVDKRGYTTGDCGVGKNFQENRPRNREKVCVVPWEASRGEQERRGGGFFPTFARETPMLPENEVNALTVGKKGMFRPGFSNEPRKRAWLKEPGRGGGGGGGRIRGVCVGLTK